MTYLLTLGCSWTDANFYSWQFPELDTSWPKWPQIVADELDLSLVNLGRGGSGNDYAFKHFIDRVYSNNPPKYVIWQLSQWSRMLLGDYRLMFSSRYHLMKLAAENRNTNQKWIWGINNVAVAMQGPEVFIENTLYYIEKVIRICREKDIKLFIFQADFDPWPLHFWDYLNNLKKEDPDLYDWFLEFIGGKNRLLNCNFTDKNVYDLIDNKHFKSVMDLNPKEVYGWPLFPQLGGKSISIKNEIIPIDGHPNSRGQEIMAKTIIENIKKWIEKK